jgi:hypothetical protein
MHMTTKMIKKSLGLFMFSGLILLASGREGYSQSFTLTVRVLDTKATSCTGQQTVLRSATVSLSLSDTKSITLPRTAITDNNGRVTFSNVSGGRSYSIAAGRTDCDRRTINFSMPNQNAEAAIGLDNCGTAGSYDVSARFLGPELATVTAGNNFTLSFVVRNNGPNGPSRPRNVTLFRLTGDTEGGVTVGSTKRVPSLCVNEEIGFDVTERPPIGAWFYLLQWESDPDQGVSNANERPRKTVTVKP